MTFPENRNHICSHILFESEWADLPLSGMVVRPLPVLSLSFVLLRLDES